VAFIPLAAAAIPTEVSVKLGRGPRHGRRRRRIIITKCNWGNEKGRNNFWFT
jgi:hypothetical protein